MDEILKKNMCQVEQESVLGRREELPLAIDAIMESMDDTGCFAHIGDDPIHFSTSVKEMIDKFRHILFPGYFAMEKIDRANLVYNIGQSVSQLYDILSEQVIHVLRHDCLRYGQKCSECETRGHDIVLKTIHGIADLRLALAADVRGVFDGDPAAKSHDEIIFSYPGLYAITVYRIAHILYNLEVPLLPRIMTEHAHSLTGIDIHPGARIGKSFVIDHGTGIVIGETSVIGNNVRVYQNVTIGALSLPADAGEQLRGGAKRHPTIEDDAIIYSGATILGGKTVIGARSVVGGNVWLTSSIPADTKVFMESPRLVYKYQDNKEDNKGMVNHEHQI